MTARTVPPMPVFLAGQKLTGTLMNQLGSYSQFWANPPMFRMYQTVTQSLTTNTFAQITCDTVDYDSDSGRAVGTPWSYTIPPGMTGRWQFSFKVNFAQNAAGMRVAALYKNGSIIATTQTNAMTNGTSVASANDVTVVACNAGDVMSLWGAQYSGSTISTDFNFPSYFEGRLVSLATP